MQIEILSPEGSIFKDSGVQEVIIPTVQGEIGVLSGHIPLIAQVSEGELKVKAGEKNLSFAVFGGFIEVLNDKVVILADYAQRADDIQAQKAEEAKLKAAAMLKEKHSKREFAFLEKDLKRAMFELKMSDKFKKKR
jgi:F-type H+-transporting ATPase subunit epsilon